MWLALGGLATVTMAWLGLYGYGWNDYELEAMPAVDALIHGHLHQFFAIAPMYGGSLLERSPFALAPGLWGGGELAVYRMLAVPCLMAALALGLWLVALIRASAARAPSSDSSLSDGVSRRTVLTRSPQTATAALVFGLCVANPLTLAALELGHPDELFGGALCVAAVLLAARGQPVWAGLALGVAFANKQWAILAVGPVLLALPGRRALCLGAAAGLAGALLAPFAILGRSGFEAGVHGAANAGSTIFQPWQLWWFFGRHGHVVKGLGGNVKVGYRTAPAWIGAVSHPLIVGLELPATAGAWLGLRHRLKAVPAHGPAPSAAGAEREATALLLLAVLLGVRCALDTWDIVYYPLPFVLALTAWEALGLRRLPVVALASTVAVWASCKWLPSFASADVQAAFFAGWSLPLIVSLAWALLGGERTAVGGLPHDGEVLGKFRQRLVAVGGDMDQVLDPHPQLALQIDAGLDGHYVAGG